MTTTSAEIPSATVGPDAARQVAFHWGETTSFTIYPPLEDLDAFEVCVQALHGKGEVAPERLGEDAFFTASAVQPGKTTLEAPAQAERFEEVIAKQHTLEMALERMGFKVDYGPVS